MLVVILTLPNTVTQLIKHILKNWALRTKDNMKQIWIHDYLGAGSISLPNFSQLHPPSLLSDLTFMTEVGVTSSSDSQVSLQCWTCWGVRVHRKHHHCYRSRWRNPAWKWRKCYHFCNMAPLKGGLLGNCVVKISNLHGLVSSCICGIWCWSQGIDVKRVKLEALEFGSQSKNPRTDMPWLHPSIWLDKMMQRE